MAVRSVAFESAVCKYKQLTADERIRMIAENEEKAWKDRQAEIKYAKEEGKAEGRAEGRAEGIYNQKIEIAKKMLLKNKNIEEIIDFTDLTKEEIEKLRWIIFFNFIEESKTRGFTVPSFFRNLVPRKIFNASINQNFVRIFW